MSGPRIRLVASASETLDLLRRLREWWEYDTGHLMPSAIGRIEQLDRELEAEKVLADRLACGAMELEAGLGSSNIKSAIADYLKVRG